VVVSCAPGAALRVEERRRSKVRKYFVVFLLFLSCASLIPLSRGVKVPITDFGAFWVAGKALLHGGNPYETAAAFRLQQPLGVSAQSVFVMRNPPWTLIFTLPLGLLSYSAAWVLWSVLLVASSLLAAMICWRLNGGCPQRHWIAWLVTFAFAPAIACISVGQLGLIVLLGTALFLLLEEQHEFWAGVALVMISVKPQLVYLLLLAILLWAMDRRRWRLIGGAAAGFAFSLAVAAAFDPQVFVHYWQKLTTDPVSSQFLPTLGGGLRLLFGVAWLQVAPAALALAWLAFYYPRHRRQWNWLQQAPILLLISVISTPYAFLIDEVVLLPAFLQLAALREGKLRGINFLYLTVNGIIFAMLLRGPHVTSPWYMWTPITWGALYWYGAIRSRPLPSRTSAKGA
jgi:hypothetical protein